MSKEQVMDYVMTTPSNPNRAVLSGMLDEISGTQLPSPTPSDNGKVLGVDGGEYKLVEQSGGAEVELLANTTSEESFVDGNTLHASGIVTSGISVGTDGAAPGYNIPNSSIPSSVYNKLTESNLGIGIMHFYYLNGPSNPTSKCVSIPCNIIKSNGYVRLEPSGAMYQPLWQGSWALSYDIAIPIV